MNLRVACIIIILWPILICAHAQEMKSPLAISIRYSDGLSSKSSTSQPPEINLFMQHTHLHLVVLNASDHNVTLWRPFCPPGDEAISFEFKESETSNDIMKARIAMGYTAGMGYAKTLTLVPNDSLVFNVDFLRYWEFPFRIKSGEIKTLLIRAVYNPKSVDDVNGPKAKDIQTKDLWSGRVETGWEKVVINNRTGKGLFGPGYNFFSSEHYADW
jgi:hypothetical protein